MVQGPVHGSTGDPFPDFLRAGMEKQESVPRPPRAARAALRRSPGIVLLLWLALAGCETTNVPVRRDLLGSWVTQDLPGAVIRMTVAETARSVDGAGTLADATGVHPFRISGALAIDEVGLFFDFVDRPDLVFQGVFTSDDRIEGTLSGTDLGALPVVLLREDLAP